MAVGVVSIFLMVTGIGMFTGNWDNQISKEEYLFHYQNLNGYGHPTGTEAVKKFNKESIKKINSKSINQKKLDTEIKN